MDSHMDTMNNEEFQAIRDEIIVGTRTGIPVEIQSLETGFQPPSMGEIDQAQNFEENPHIEQIAQLMYNFLEVPIVEDHFDTDDKKRDAWEAKVYTEYGQIGTDIIQNNILRVNKLIDAVSSVVFLGDLVPEIKSVVDKLNEEVKDNRKYKPLSREQKIAAVKQAKLVVIASLYKLSKKPLPSGIMAEIEAYYA